MDGRTDGWVNEWPVGLLSEKRSLLEQRLQLQGGGDLTNRAAGWLASSDHRRAGRNAPTQNVHPSPTTVTDYALD